LKKSFNIYILYGIIIVLNLFLTKSFNIWYISSTTLFYIFIVKFVNDLGKEILVRDLIVIIAVFQYLIGAILGYVFKNEIPESYVMRVENDTYFSYVLPATLAYIIGLYIPLSKSKTKLQLFTSVDNYKKGIILTIIGFLFDFIPSLGFLGVLLASFKYVGLFYFVASTNTKKYYWIVLILGYLLMVESIGAGMFHALLLWGGFFIVIYYLFYPKSILQKTTIIGFSFVSIFIIQVIKPEYRAVIWGNQEENNSKYGVFSDIIITKINNNESMFNLDNTITSIPRINQGWIISNVMDYIPNSAPFAYGETINESIIASIFPRFLMPDKAVAGGVDNMKKYAGINVGSGTSMDISQVGEGYANFGVLGGVIFMFALGLLINIVLVFIEKKQVNNPELLFWIPFVFLQVVKAESSLVTMLNHLVKASLITWIFFMPFMQKGINRIIKKI
jgi:hypothetical protein